MAVIALLLLVSLTSSVCGLHEDPAKKFLEVENVQVDLLTEITMLRQDLEGVKAELRQARATQKETEERLQLQAKDMEDRIQLQEQRTDRLVTDVVPRHEIEENQITFSVVSHASFGSVSVDTNIPFPVVYANVGGGWQPTINAFLVTKSGYYLFSTSMYSSSSSTAYTHIVHTTLSGSERVASLYSQGGEPESDANTVIIHAEFGDYVSVQLAPSGQISSWSTIIYSTFSGIFLFP